jgi:hypothetical protein
LKIQRLSTVASPINKMPSAYCNMDIGTPSDLTKKGLRRLSSTTVLNRPPNRSVTKRKIRGARESPCLRPQLIFITSVGFKGYVFHIGVRHASGDYW